MHCSIPRRTFRHPLIHLFSFIASMHCVSSTAGAQGRPDVLPGAYFVAFRAGVTPENLAGVTGLGATVHAAFPSIRAISIRTRDARVAEALARNPRVLYVEPVPMRYARGLEDAQLVPSINNGLYGLITTRAAEAQVSGATGAGINVGIADTGIDYTHPDIAGNYRGGIDYVSNDNDPWWNGDPNETHATHVAGILLGVNNDKGIVGAAHSANLYHARVLGGGTGSSDNIMKGVRWLVETKGCKIVNLSLGGRFGSTTEQNFYNEMRSKGALIFAAAGNDGATTLSYPARYASVVAVGAVDKLNAHASFSNTGSGIDLSAPGVAVLSSVPANTGFESSVTTTAEHTALGMEYAGQTNGTTGALVNCGLGKTAADFPPAVNGNIALIQRGDISFADKVTNAMNAGAIAAVIYNNVAGDFKGTLGSAGNWIPAVSVSDVTGATLLSQTGTSATVLNKVSRWDHYDGTSMATPYAAGVAAQVWSANPALGNASVESILTGTAKDLGASGYDTTFGYGLVDAMAAVEQARGGGSSPPAAPTNLTATAGNSQVSLTWNSSSGATGYRVYRSTTSGGPYGFLASAASTSYLDTAVSNGTTYYYVVTAVNSAGESGYSNQASATPQAAVLNVNVWTTNAVGTVTTSFRFNETVYIWNRVTSGSGNPVGGASVRLEVRTPRGKLYVGNGTTDAAGYVIFSVTFRKGDGAGTYNAAATAAAGGASGAGTAVFTVQ